MDFVKFKRVTDPFDDKAKARLGVLSYVSSGSEHSAEEDHEHSPSLSQLVHGFLENDSDTESQLANYDSDSERVDSVHQLNDAVEVECVMVQGNNNNDNVDSYKKLLAAHVSEAIETMSCVRSNRSVFLRNVMGFLRELGHNAAICKSRWESSGGGLSAGNYEFIDVVQSLSNSRYFIDVDFAAQFEIARPTDQYSKLLHSLPSPFIGRAEELRKLVTIMCDVAKRSLRSRKLSVPPWRKNTYMENKWFGSYRRTTNPVPDQPVQPVRFPVGGVKCSFVGFNDAVSDHHRGFFVPTR
ncbi:hypothetical protein FCV25MIE_29056 [Fagus crenata]